MKKKIGKRNSISVGVPDRLGRVKLKSITYTKQGIIDDNLYCPECKGDGHFLEDNTHSNGGTMNPSLCQFCKGKGTITEDRILDVIIDDEGEPRIIYKEGDEPCQT